MARIAMRMNNGGRIAEHFKRRVAGSIDFGGVPQSDCLRTLLHWICIFGTTFLGFSLGSADACSLDVPSLKSRLEMLAHQIDGRIGICVACTGYTISFNGNQRFSLQSVMKIAIAVAVLDRVDHGSLRLDEPMIVRKADLSVGHQPLANLIGKDGYHTTLQDLLFCMIVDSDNAATDLLFARLGGPANVQSTLNHKRITGFRINKNERELESSEKEVAGRSQTDYNTTTPLAMMKLLLSIKN